MVLPKMNIGEERIIDIPLQIILGVVKLTVSECCSDVDCKKSMDSRDKQPTD